MPLGEKSEPFWRELMDGFVGGGEGEGGEMHGGERRSRRRSRWGRKWVWEENGENEKWVWGMGFDTEEIGGK
jgi:hypothetical protein